MPSLNNSFPMKKISSLKELQHQKELLQVKQQQLEKRLKGNLEDIKEAVQPVNLIKDGVNTVIQHALNTDAVIKVKNSIQNNAPDFIKRMLSKAAESISKV